LFGRHIRLTARITWTLCAYRKERLALQTSELIELLRAHVAPILTADVLDTAKPSNSREACFAAVDPNTIAIKAEKEDIERVIVQRYPEFSPQDRKIARCFVDELFATHSAATGNYRDSILKTLPLRSIARHFDHVAAATTILEQFDSWSSQTYEGGRITSCIGIASEPPNDEESGVYLDAIFDHDFSAVLSNGFDTMLIADAAGKLLGSRQFFSSL